ncbi:MAG: hypothetical protein A3K10_03380 [Bacteroidetes bacterium RIFCSPLOWO2_12_FULL_31_6]|nr:MAG: hypothetical protein A3K10_03380 [Bacteroidetes bacterium RIFCSPLOWO2_12_FULL_31_6]
MTFEFNPINKNIDETELINDVKLVAKQLNKDKLTIKEYDDNGKFNSSTIIRRFKTWNIALEKAELQISNQLNISKECKLPLNSDCKLPLNSDQLKIEFYERPKKRV